MTYHVGAGLWDGQKISLNFTSTFSSPLAPSSLLLLLYPANHQQESPPTWARHFSRFIPVKKEFFLATVAFLGSSSVSVKLLQSAEVVGVLPVGFLKSLNHLRDSLK